MKRTIIERLALIKDRAPGSSARDRNLEKNQSFDLERVIWDEEYREQVMQILKDGYTG